MKNKQLFLTCLLTLAFLSSAASGVFAANYTVNRSDDTGDGICDDTCTLRDAIMAANTTEPLDDTINFAPFLTTITLTAEIPIDQSGRLFINGLGANRLTIDGGSGSNRIFYTFSSQSFSSELHISDVTLTGGNGGGAVSGGEGGAIYSDTSLLKLIRVHITGNTATYGGGLVSNAAGLFVSDSTFSNNSASADGGAINNRGDAMLIVNSTISGNTAAGDGGGFYSISSAVLNFATITKNTALRGGGLVQNAGTTNFSNSIVAGNENLPLGNYPEIFRANVTADFISDGFNLVGDQSGDSGNTNLPIIYQPSDITDTPPQLIVLSNYGGTTPTHALQFNSPAKDAADASSVWQFDQRGFERDLPDIGAYEIQNNQSWYVTETTDTNGVCDETCSLREAIAAAPVGGKIEFAPNITASTPILLNDEITINKDLTIFGAGADKIVIKSNFLHRIFFINVASYVIIHGVTLTEGAALTGEAAGEGGAVYVLGGDLTLDSVYLIDNRATRGGGVAFSLFGFQHTIRNSTFSENIGGSSGGGFYCNGEGNVNGPTVTVLNSTFTLQSGGTNGLAFAVVRCNVIARNITVSGNIGSNNGGIFVTSNGTLNIANSIVSGNTATTTDPVFLRPEISLFAGGSITSGGYNLIGDSTGDSTNTGIPVIYQPTDILDTPPLLGALQMNGGSMPTLALLAGSPAINAGDNTKAINPRDNFPLTTDQRGFLRIIGNSPPLVDIGAFEFGSAASWTAATPTGTNVNTTAGPVTVQFADVSQAGNITVSPIDASTAGTLPTGFSLGAGLPAFEISTSAVYTPPITVCIQVPLITNPVTFNALNIFHNENGILVNRTISRNFAAKTICASVSSLSPFVVAQNLAPTAASVSVSGRVTAAEKQGISNVRLLLTNQAGETRSAVTNSFGYFSFAEVPVGETYVLTAHSKKFTFGNGTLVLNLTESVNDIIFLADSQ